MKTLAYLLMLLACPLGAQTLPNGWKIHPAGTQVAVDTLPLASILTPDGKYLIVMNAGAHAPSLSVIDPASAKEMSRVPVPDAWLGLAFNKAGDKLYVGGGSGAAVFEFSFANGTLSPGRTFSIVAAKDRTPQDFAGDVRFSPDFRLLYVANVHRDAVVVINPQSGLVISRIRTGRRPYRILFHPSGKTFYVSSWADGSVGQYDVNSGQRLANLRVAPHPLDLLWLDGAPEGQTEIRARMMVAAANTNSVYLLGASETGDLSKLETINLSLTGRQPLGMTPSALAARADGKEIYIACSDANAVAVVDLSGDRSAVKGFIPAGWYPTAITALPGKLAILNGRSNSLQLADLPDDAKLVSDTNEVIANSLYKDDLPADPIPGGPIRHVVYVVRDGGAQAEAAAPNRDQLAREFVLLSNFHSLAENTPEGVSWATAAIAPDYTQRLAPNTAAGRRRVSDFEGEDPANSPPAGYLWNAASQAGLKLRNYGFQVHNRDKATPDGEQVDRVYDPALSASTDMEYRGPDPAYSDSDRAAEFAAEMKEYDGVGEMPQLLMVRIGNDDRALGIIAEAVSKTKFWNETAMFVSDTYSAEKDHGRALVVSPWAKRGATDDTMYNQMTVLRTIEVILGLRPMTMFDAAAAPMSGVFSQTANVTPYTPAAGR